MADNDPLYRRCANCRRLYRSDASGEAAAAGYWAGWIASDDGADNPIALSQAWGDAGGTLLFLPSAPADALAFEQALIGFLAAYPAGFKPRLLWLRNPAAASAVWDADAISIGASGSTSRTTDFKFADYRLRVPALTALALNSGGSAPAQFAFSGSGLNFISPLAGFASTSLTLPLAGAALGAWQGTLALAGATAADTLESLGVMLRYARLQTGSTDATESVDMPILRQDGSATQLGLQLDPLAPLDRARTALRFLNQPVLASGWATTLGHAVTLTPVIAPAAGIDPAGLAFAATPRRLSDPSAGTKYHLAPVGAFALATKASNALRARLPIAADGTQEALMLGLAGTEYLALPTTATTQAVFVPAQPALLLAPQSGQSGPLSAAAQTAYASFVDASQPVGMAYYAQPQSSPLYAAGDSSTVLDFKPVLSGRLAPLSGTAEAPAALTALPVGAYRGLDQRLVTRAGAIELAGLAPSRRSAIPSAAASVASGNTPTRAVTPPGLIAVVDDTRFDSVVIANLPQSSTPEVAFGPISAPFQLALQSNQLFFVVADPSALGSQTANLELELSKWRFKLAPSAWRSDANSPTLLLFKFAARTLVDLAADPASWGWQEAGKLPGGGGLAATSKALGDIFSAAAAAPAGSVYRNFYDQVANNPAWTGVLFLNAAIDVGELDPQLGFITAGVVLDRFYAHHVGFALTPYTLDAKTKLITLGQTAAFALVDYQDRRDLNLTKTVPFAYKTLALTAVFTNAALSGFSAEVELLTNRLFATSLTKQDPERGNNLVLSGSFHTVDGAPAYAFDLIGRNVFATSSGALTQIEVQNVGLQTERVDSNADALITRFTLSGNLRFADNPDFDLFGWGAASDGSSDGQLRYGNLVVRMHSQRSGGGEVSFDNLEGALNFDLANSKARPQSLIAKFPLTLTSFVAVAPADDAPAPDKLGYASIAMPLDQSVLSAPWYGLSYTLQLGTLGNLAGSVGLNIELLAAWAPATDDQDAGIYVGLKVPGLSSLGIQWPLQGVLSLGFRSFELQRYALTAPQSGFGYLLRLHRLALSFLGFSVPPGNTDVVLFGNPDTGAKGPLGWYAAYAKDLPAKKKSAVRAPGALRAGPRSAVARLRRTRGGNHTP